MLKRDPDLPENKSKSLRFILVICFGSRFNVILMLYILLLLIFLPLSFYCVMYGLITDLMCVCIYCSMHCISYIWDWLFAFHHMQVSLIYLITLTTISLYETISVCIYVCIYRK